MALAPNLAGGVGLQKKALSQNLFSFVPAPPLQPHTHTHTLRGPLASSSSSNFSHSFSGEARQRPHPSLGVGQPFPLGHTQLRRRMERGRGLPCPEEAPSHTTHTYICSQSHPAPASGCPASPAPPQRSPVSRNLVMGVLGRLGPEAEFTYRLTCSHGPVSFLSSDNPQGAGSTPAFSLPSPQ